MKTETNNTVDTKTSYEFRTFKQLKAIAKEHKIPGYYKMNKGQLVEALVALKKAETKKAEAKKAPAKKAPAKKAPAKKAEKVAAKKTDSKIHSFKFGKSIDHQDICAMANEVWDDLVALENVSFDGHYWWCDVRHAPSNSTCEHVRCDYFINYMRIPRNLQGYEDLMKCKQNELAISLESK